MNVHQTTMTTINSDTDEAYAHVCLETAEMSRRFKVAPIFVKTTSGGRIISAIRAIRNHIDCSIECVNRTRGHQYVGRDCYFVAPCDLSSLTDTAFNGRYIMPAEELNRDYKPIAEVLGSGWKSQLA